MIFRVLFVVSTLKRSGPTNQLFNIIKNLDSSRFEAILLTLSPEPKDSKLKDFESLGIKLHSLNLSRFFGIFFAKLKLKEFIQMVQPTLIHTQGIRADSLLASLNLELPWVLTARNYPLEDYPSKFGKLWGGLMARKHVSVLKHCTNVIACSKSIQTSLAEIGIESFPIQNGVAIGEVSLNPAFTNKYERPIFVTVGSLIPRKNIRFIVDAFNLYKNQVKSSGSLVILGEGFERKEIESVVTESVYLMGNVSNVTDYLSSADFFISASLSEGLPNTVLEALAAGLPVILSDIPSHKEINLECNGASSIFNLADGVMGLVERIINISQIFDVSSRLDAKRVANEVFSSEVMSHHYQDYYFKLLKNK